MKQIVNWVKDYKWFLAIFLLGAAIRLFLIHIVPPGLNQDEASIGYDAYAVLHYGIDRNGYHNPIHFIAWGSGQNALYAYLSMPFIYLFGLTPLSVRAVSIIFGIIGLLVFYLLFTRIHHNKLFALLGMFLLAISPWHIMMSRWALESNLFPSLILIGVLLLYTSFEENKWFPVACFVFALSLYAYGTSYFFVPVFLIIAVGYVLFFKRLKIKQLILGIAVFIVTSIPILLFVLINRLKLASIDLGLFTIPRLTGTPRFDQVSSVFSGNMLQQGIENFKKFIVMFLKQDDGLIWNSLPPYGFLYIFCIPLLLIGLGKAVYSLKDRRWNHEFVMLAWFISAVAMAFITDVNINRINIIYIPSIYFVATGVWALRKKFAATFIPIVAAFAICFVGFTNDYFTKFPDKVSSAFFESLGDALQYATNETDGKIAVTNTVNMPYIFALFYEKTDPNVFQDTVQYVNPDSPFQSVSSFGRYYFTDERENDQQISAFVIPNSKISQYQGGEFKLETFKHYSVAVRHANSDANAELNASELNIIKDSSFESEDGAWHFTGNSGIGTNRPVTGSNLAYLDIGNENIVSQQLMVEQEGTYTFSAFVSAGGDGGKIGIKVGNTVLAEMNIPHENDYLSLSQEVTLSANEPIEVYVIGGNGWVNVDDISLTLMK